MQQQIDDLVGRYEQRTISRRALVEGLVALALGARVFGQTLPSVPEKSLVHARTLNHVTMFTNDVARSKALYQRLTGLGIRDEAKDFCEFRLEGGFLGIYAPDAGQRPGFDHFCLGIDNYEPKRVLADLQRATPDAHPELVEDQVYIHDPNGVRVQFADVNYKL